MSQHDSINRELLAGYADGELSGQERQVVESWLVEHPELRSELDAQRAWGRKNAVAMHKSVPQPNDSAWHRALNKVKSALEPARPMGYDTSATMPTRQRSRWQIPASIASIAAALLIAIAIGPTNGPGGLTVSGGEAFAVASPADVEVIALQGDDSLVVIGMPILSDRLEMVTIGDVSLDAIVGDAEFFGPRNPQTPGDLKKPAPIGPAERTLPTP